MEQMRQPKPHITVITLVFYHDFPCLTRDSPWTIGEETGEDFIIFLSCLDVEEILLYCGAKREIGVFADGTRTEEDLYRGYDLSIWNFLDDIWNCRAAGRSGHPSPVSGEKVDPELYPPAGNIVAAAGNPLAYFVADIGQRRAGLPSQGPPFDRGFPPCVFLYPLDGQSISQTPERGKLRRTLADGQPAGAASFYIQKRWGRGDFAGEEKPSAALAGKSGI